MLLPANLQLMKLGMRYPNGRPTPVAPRLSADLDLEYVYSRILETPRISGDNANLGDCFPTGCCNAVQTHLKRIGRKTVVRNSDAVAAYEGMAGYVPGDPATDQGTDPEVGFDWWLKNPIAGFKLRNVTAISTTAEAEIRDAIGTYGGVGLCVELAVEQQNQRVWQPAGTPGSWGGHFVFADSYEGALTKVTSWGDEFYIDRAYFQTPFVVAAYAMALESA